MDRRSFLHAAALALPSASLLSVSARTLAASNSPATDWRVFEVTTRVEVQKPVGLTRLWLPVPLIPDTDYQKSLGNGWSTETGSRRST